jgi:hypothetical protein
MAWQYYITNGTRRLARSPQHAAELHAKARDRRGEALDGRACVVVYNRNGGMTQWRVRPGHAANWKARPWVRN